MTDATQVEKLAQDVDAAMAALTAAMPTQAAQIAALIDAKIALAQALADQEPWGGFIGA